LSVAHKLGHKREDSHAWPTNLIIEHQLKWN
jgi:hypothetical protein